MNSKNNNYNLETTSLETKSMSALTSSNTMNVIKRDGKMEPMDFEKIIKRVKHLTEDLPNINKADLARQIISQSFDGVKTEQLDLLAAVCCGNLVTKHFEWGTLATRYLISNLHKNTSPSFSEVTQNLYNNELINKTYYETVMKNKEKLNSSINYNKDYNYSFFGFKTLERAYLIRVDEKVVERPQHMIMRVCVAMHSESIKDAIKSYKLMSDGYFTHATPTLFNMGTNMQQASSCFLLTMVDDSIDGIYETIKRCALISKTAGGIGCSVHPIRSLGSKIKGTNGTSDGIIPMLKVFNDTARYVNQGGRRKGSFAMYVEPWHADIEDFLMLRRNTGSEEMRARDLFYALWIPDLFMKRVEQNGDWTLMCPNKCPGLCDTHSEEFETLYEKYEKEGRGNKTIKAQELWYSILDSQIETGTPYMLYKDACNSKSNQSNLGTIRSSNLCCEIVEYTSPDEVAVCNLASIALPKFIEYDKEEKPFFNFKKLEEVTKTITRNLNKIIDINHYPVKEAENSNRRHRPIGIGVQGLADVFALMRMAFDSEQASHLNKQVFGYIYLASVEASMDFARKRKKIISDYKKMIIAVNNNGKDINQDTIQSKSPVPTITKEQLLKYKKEHYILDEEEELPVMYSGAYSSFIGSPAHKGLLQYDLWNVEPLKELKERFTKVKESIKKHGLRNSLLVAPMPTASTSQILGNNECFEPYTSNIYKRRTLAGEFKIINPHLLKDLIDLGIWSDTIKDKIILNEGSVQNIEEIPADIRKLYKTVWEIKQKVVIDMAADRGIYIDQSQSMNVFISQPNYKKLSSMHFYGWKKGLKTGMYYLRSQSAVQAQKFSVDISVEKQSNETKKQVMACSRDNPDCDSCGS
jgi:ribonucleotide reductase alpha subunit